MTRSALMSRIRSSGNRSTELRLCAALSAMGVRGWRRQYRVGGITADIGFPAANLLVFVDGCFWHACSAHSNAAGLDKYWRGKVLGNQARDRSQEGRLRALGWSVARVWEHDLRVPALRWGVVKYIQGRISGA